MTKDVSRPHITLAKIAEYADGLCDRSFEGWSVAYAIKKMAKGEWTPAEADEFVEKG